MPVARFGALAPSARAKRGQSAAVMTANATNRVSADCRRGFERFGFTFIFRIDQPLLGVSAGSGNSVRPRGRLQSARIAKPQRTAGTKQRRRPAQPATCVARRRLMAFRSPGSTPASRCRQARRRRGGIVYRIERNPKRAVFKKRLCASRQPVSQRCLAAASDTHERQPALMTKLVKQVI